MEFIEYWDQTLFRSIYEIPVPVIFSQLVTHLSTMGGIWVAFGLGMLIWGDADRRRWGMVLFLAILVEWGLIDGLLKPFFARPRPFVELGLVGWDRWISASSFSFPSGHAGVSFVSAVILGHVFSAQRMWFYGLASWVALSRVHLGVHYPSDILAGAFFGILVGLFAIRIGPGFFVKGQGAERG